MSNDRIHSAEIYEHEDQDEIEYYDFNLGYNHGYINGCNGTGHDNYIGIGIYKEGYIIGYENGYKRFITEQEQKLKQKQVTP